MNISFPLFFTFISVKKYGHKLSHHIVQSAHYSLIVTLGEFSAEKFLLFSDDDKINYVVVFNYAGFKYNYKKWKFNKILVTKLRKP